MSTQPYAVPGTSVPPKFLIYVIESPTPWEIYHDRGEGKVLKLKTELDGIPCITRVAITREVFEGALKAGVQHDFKAYPDHLPILHISAHGNSDGIGLSDGTVLTWDELRDLLVPLNEHFSGNLLLCMSSCEGFGACRMAMRTGDDPHPYWALFANTGKPVWADTAHAYMTLYHLIAKGKSFADALTAMRAASGDEFWVVETADTSKQHYVEYVSAELVRQVAHPDRRAVPPTAVPPSAGPVAAV